ncbi:hypothetical protein BU26DRAFT_515662 [Trematosphaeria pertusa]|uniref:Uncharacterized protein n=1 Tax=Trematosphaeria pertusa TaxID=390896 RepID=A0A6A6IS31_9PLEO|nr:uncharacterized protein BU26DRAFT_515662 [Trematosphaeria pertusa]KAF2253301.1 hypothetical protein BU26DRAFT_515662 [Trematosphaeria pertusa]
MVYSLNIFAFVAIEDFEPWIENRLPAQMQAITTLQPDPLYTAYVGDGMRPKFTTTFPNLKRLYINQGGRRRVFWDEVVAVIVKDGEKEGFEVVIEYGED